MDSDSDECQGKVAATEEEECCEEVLLEPHLRLQCEYSACSCIKASLSLDSASTSEDNDNVLSGPHPQTHVSPKPQWTLPSHLQKSVVHTLRGGPRGNNDSEETYVNDGSTPLSISMFISHRFKHCL